MFVAVSFQGAFAQNQGRPPGIEPHARLELAGVGVNKYVGQFQPSASEAIGDWTKYTYDTQGGDGPVCIAGSELSVFHQARDPKKLMVILDGGGACWQDFYFCSVTADSNPPAGGIFNDDSGTGIDNPLADWSKMFVSYCDGSVFSGDNTVIDPAFPAASAITAGCAPDGRPRPARALHPQANQVLLGASARVASASPARHRARIASCSRPPPGSTS
jgi:hypothetical protein